MAAEPEVLYSVNNGVALCTLNRPKNLNGWTATMQELYFDSLDEAERDPSVRVIVVTGAGRAFCSGADLGPAGGVDFWAARPMTHPTSVSKPIIAAINGACAGLGMQQALVTDIRFAAAGAKFTTAFSRRGLIAELGTSWLLPHTIGRGAAMEILLSGRTFLAEEALQMGLVSRVFPAETLLKETLAYAVEMAENVPPGSAGIIKHQVNSHPDLTLPEALSRSNKLMMMSTQLPEFREGVRSFLKKRPPNFTGLDKDANPMFAEIAKQTAGTSDHADGPGPKPAPKPKKAKL